MTQCGVRNQCHPIPLRRNITRLVWALTLALLVPVGGQAAEDGQKFKDWIMRCEKPNETAPEQCHIFQNAKDKDSGRDIAQLAIGRVPDSKAALVIVSLPLGVFLPPGIQLQIDQKEPMRVPIEVCDPNGCRAGFPLTDELAAAFKAGQQLTLSVQDPAGNKASVPFSLSGFTAGYNSLPPL